MSSGIDNLASQLQKTINEKDKKKKTGYYAQSEVLKVTDDTVWVKIPGGIDETPVAKTVDAKPGDKVQVRVEGGRAWIAGNYTDPATGDSRVINLEKTVTKEFTVVKELVADKATIGQLRAAEAEIDDLTATKADISDLNAATARIGDLEADHVSVSDLNAATGRIGDLEADHVSTSDLNAATARIGTLETDNTNIKGRLTAAEADIDNVEADTAKIHNLTANQISATVGYIGDLTSGNVTAQNIIADHATVGSLDSNYAHITNGVIDNAKIGYADVNDLNAHYAGIDLANVNNAWIQNGVIKNGAIGDAQIGGVSANKLTAGTIDASNITVTNLNADNITTGTINGQRIGTGSLSLDKLSEDVYTEAEVNTIVDGLNDRIDGAIETFTGTVVPTLYNSPANTWTTTKLKDQHVGDVYYVVNSSSEQNGYCYRFTKSGSTYSWQLIKDSDVTAALARLETAEGKIGNIEAFDQEISTFKTTTEGQISTLQTKTTNLETSLGDKVSTATFNELSQTVDENSASITSLTTTVESKADSSTVTTLSNTVNSVSQTATANSSKISNLTTVLGTNADGTTKTGDIVHRTSAVEQDLSGFKTTVSETYTTKTDFNTYKANTKGVVSKTDYYLLSDNDEEPAGTAYEYKTASGETATFDDGADNIQMPSIKVSIEPIQDLNGYDKPWAGGAGKNKATPLEVGRSFQESKDIGSTYEEMLYTNSSRMRSSSLVAVNGQEFTVSFDASTYRVCLVAFDENKLYVGKTSGFVNYQSVTFTRNNSNWKYVAFAVKRADEATVTDADAKNCKLQVEFGSTATAYEPYENICPISGWDEVKTYVAGKNLFDVMGKNSLTIAGVTYSSNGKCIVFNGTKYGANYANVTTMSFTLPSGAYYAKAFVLGGTSTSSNIALYLNDGSADSGAGNIWGTEKSFTTNEPKTFFPRFAIWNDNVRFDNYEVGIVISKTSNITEWASFDSFDTYTTALGQTIYGGTLDVVSSVMTIDRVMIEMDGSTDELWSLQNGVFSAYIPNNVYYSTYTSSRNVVISDRFKSNGIKYRNNCGDGNIIKTVGANRQIACYSSSYADVNEFIASLADNPMTVVYELATPQTIQLTPQEVKSLLGINNVWADAGTVDVTYVASSESEWTTETLTPNKYSPYVWWKYKEEYSNDTEFTSTPVIFNSYSQDILQTVTENYVTKTTFEVKADEIAGDISTVETTTKQYTDGKITQEVTDRNAAITAKATEITTSVSETYATKDTVNGIDGRVSAAETAITQKADSVTVSAIATDLANNYTKTADFSVAPSQISSAISTAQTNATNAANSATDTKLTSYSTTTQMNSAINQKANEITQAVSETYQTISGMGDYSTTTQMNSAIQQQANSIALSVAQTEIGKVRIGGQNLIENSEHLGLDVEPYTNSTATVYGTTVLDGEKCYYASGSKYVQVDFPTLTIGESYIFSCDVARQSGGSTVHVFITIGTNSPVDVGTAVGGTWKRFEVPFTASEETTFAKVQVYTTNGRNDYIGHFRHFKLEHGNTATDWSPAPADLKSYADSAVTTAKAEIKVTTDGISTEVAKKVGNDEVISKINQSAETIQIEASKVNIAGAAIFTSGRLSQTSLNNAYDAKGAADTAKAEAIAEIPTDVSELNNDVGYQNATQVSTAVTNGVSGKADKTAAVAEEQYIYISKASGTSSVGKNTTWVSSSDDVQNTWTIKRPTYDSDYPVLFIAKQKKVVSGTVTCTTPVKDDTTTVIDGGHITTGTIDASQVTVTNIDADNINSGKLASNYIETSSIIISDLTNDKEYYTAGDVDERIEDKTYDLVTTVSDQGDTIASNSTRIDEIVLQVSAQNDILVSVNTDITELSERIDPYENSIIVTDTSVTVQSGNGSVRIEDDKVTLKGGGNTVAWTDTEALNSKKIVATELHMGSLEVNDDESVSYVGSIAIIARQNGHVSIKKVQ